MPLCWCCKKNRPDKAFVEIPQPNGSTEREDICLACFSAEVVRVERAKAEIRSARMLLDDASTGGLILGRDPEDAHIFRLLLWSSRQAPFRRKIGNAEEE